MRSLQVWSYELTESQEDKYMTTQLADMDSSLDFDELQELRHFQSKLIVGQRHSESHRGHHMRNKKCC